MKKVLLNLGLLIGLLSFLFADPIYQIENNEANWKLLHDLNIDYLARTPETIDILLDLETSLKLKTKRARDLNILNGAKKVLDNAYLQFDKSKNLSESRQQKLYHTYSELNEALKELSLKYQDKVKLFEAGTTSENRSIYAVELTNSKINQKKPTYLVVGAHHAREWISAEVPLAFLKDLLENYATDLEAKELIDNSKIVIVPMLNVDGAIHSHEVYSMWRKNRKQYQDGYYGVDNNRNYAYKWSASGSSTFAGSDTYMGPHSMSELENLAIEKLAKKYNFIAAVSFHSYSKLVLWPWSYTNKIKAKDDQILRKHGVAMANIMGYRPIQSADLYPSAGDTDDFLYGTYGIMSYTVELGTRFVPNETEYQEIITKAPKMLRYLFTNAKEHLSKNRASNYELLALLEDLVIDVNKANLSHLNKYSNSEINLAMDSLNMDHQKRLEIKKLITQIKQFKD